MRQNYLVCYDICNSKRLYKVRKYLYSLALGGQKSTLVIPLSKRELSLVVKNLLQLTNEEDIINIICIQKSLKYFGTKEEISFTNKAIIL